MKVGKFNIIILFSYLFFTITFAEDEILSVPIITLDDISPTFEEDKSELEKKDEEKIEIKKTEENINLSQPAGSNKIYVNLIALDKITAKTSSIRIPLGEKKFFGKLEIIALKCQMSESEDILDTVAYLQVKDLSAKDNNQVFVFNGWTFASSPTLRSIDHPIYDLWLTNCENI